MTEPHKRALVASYYLSRFDRKGVRALGFQTFNEAYEKIGRTLGVPSSTVKHMRDSFDPYCSQVRVGWYQRRILPSRANVIQAYDELSQEAMSQIVREILSGTEKATRVFVAPISAPDLDQTDLLAEDSPFAYRLRTGDRAEAIFIELFPQLGQFRGSVLEDTRRLGIGFDFRATFERSFQAVEVKGVCEAHGYISFTDKEWSVARLLGPDYILAVVRSLDYTPRLDLIAHPTQSISAQMRTIESVSVCWNAKV